MKNIKKIILFLPILIGLAIINTPANAVQRCITISIGIGFGIGYVEFGSAKVCWEITIINTNNTNGELILSAELNKARALALKERGLNHAPYLDIITINEDVIIPAAEAGTENDIMIPKGQYERNHQGYRISVIELKN